MSTNPLKNVSLKNCRKFLTNAGCKNIRNAGGHEIWSRSDLLRPIIIQSHIDPVPERIMKQIINALEVDRDEFIKILNSK
jgi:hypothetical protein